LFRDPKWEPLVVNQQDLDDRTHHLYLRNKQLAGTQHNQHWWPSRMSELCCVWRTSSIVTTPYCKNVFEAYARIFVYVNALTPVTCVGQIIFWWIWCSN